MGEINLMPQEHFLKAERLDALIQLWLDDCVFRLPHVTVKGYEHKIGYFRRWWAAVGPDRQWELRRRDFQVFAVSLEAITSAQTGRVLAYYTRRDVLRRIKQMFRWAYHPDHQHVDRDYGVWVPEASGSATIRTATPIDHLRRLMEATSLSRQPMRDRAILAVLIGTGVRRAECSSINVEDVQIDADNSGLFKVRAKKVKHRTVHERMIAFDAFAGKYIRAYLDARGAAHGPFFIGRYKGRRLAPDGVFSAVKRLIGVAGLVGQIQGPHDLRRAFATAFARARPGEGYGKLLSKQLGHSTYKMTSQYTLQDIEDVRAALISPFAWIENGV